VAVWKKRENWLYEIFERDVKPDALPGFQDIVRLWQGKCGDRPAPALADFDFYDFVGWHGKIIINDVSYDPFDYRFRLVGVDVADRLGADYTGRYYSELVADGINPIEDFEFYEMTSRQMLISRVSGDLSWTDRRYTGATFVEFPLSDNGKMATHLLAAMI
jgi:hypothetical protein